ncbi:MAG: enoyl-CoA hydratase/isomerase family protein [Candidatus Hydrogenedentes bacterium]|nr:enoyl-CoA hydratase/isomerase family protein [Candidatus Hydrogenedentota bacterium]
MAYEHVIVEKSNHITTVTINRPEVMNALHPPAQKEMDDIFNDFAEDPEQWVAIITGAGDKAFSAGNDLKWQAAHGAEAVREIRRTIKGGFGGLHRRMDLFKPLIAAVNGFALGGGFEIALACDIIVASENATFGLPEPRVGLMAAAGGVHRLPRQIPYHAAMGVMLAGKRLSASEAAAYGLVNEVVAPDALMACAQTWASEILKGAPISVRASKEAAIMGQSMPLERALDSIFPLATSLYESEDFVEGPRAFAEKRTPNWKGK